jgi:hypothetical protein
MNRIVSALAALLFLVPGAVEAQSLFSAAGLGTPVESFDGRTRALGGVGVGLLGPEVSPTDPAALGLLGAPTAIITSQPSWVDFDDSGANQAGSFQNNRFPLIGVAYPAWKLGMMAVTVGGYLDQRYRAERPVTVELSEGPVSANDVFVSEGGVSRVSLSWGRQLGSTLSVGLSMGRYTGRVVRRLVREFDEIDLDASVQPYQAGGKWTYSGTSFTGGAGVQLGGFARLAGSVTRGGTLTATASGDTPGADTSYALPVEIRLGGSALLAPSLLVSGGWASADWSDAGAGSAGGSRGTSYGFGVELSRARLLGRRAPLRFGYRSSDLPFALRAGGAAETALTGGLGLVITEQGGLVLASVDLGVERGERKDLSLVERFWRGTLTLRVAGF